MSRFIGVVAIWMDFLRRRWEIIISGCGVTSALARGATLAARWHYDPQPIINQPVGLGFVRGGNGPGSLCFRPRVVGVLDVRKDF